MIEAIGNSVRLTWLPNFLKYSTKAALVGRPNNQKLITKALAFSVSKLGFPYDDNFLYDNGKYYCSELCMMLSKRQMAENQFSDLSP